MCGIIAVLSSKAKSVRGMAETLKTLEYRGYDSWGILAVDQERNLLHKAVGEVVPEEIDNKEKSCLIVGHTRWATHGGVTEVNAHPHLDSANKFAVVHNGVVDNYQQLKEELIVQKVKLKSETDTELVIQLLSLEMKDKGFLESVASLMKRIRGANAFIFIDIEEEKMIAVSTGSSLLLGQQVLDSEVSNFFTSDILAIPDDAFYLRLPLNTMVLFEKDDLLNFNLFELAKDFSFFKIKNPKLKRKVFQQLKAELGDYQSFLEKEIYEQPEIIAQQFQKDFSSLDEYLRKAKSIYLVACGTAYHAAAFAQIILTNKYKKPIFAVIASEFSNFYPSLSKENAYIFLSQSGETADVMEHVYLLEEKGVSFQAITNVEYSSLAAKAEDSILLGAGVEKSVLATKSFTAKLVVFMSLFGLKLTDSECFILKKFIADQSLLETVSLTADYLADHKSIFVLAKAKLFPIAQELALKIKEISYLHVEAFPAGELKHGPISLIEQDTPVMALIPSNKAEAERVLSNLEEVKSRGAKIIGISSKKQKVFDYFLKIPNIEELEPITMTFIAQLLAWKVAERLGRDLDKPRNLAKSVTVK